MNDEDISTTAAKFQKICSDDIEPEFVPKIVHFKNFVGQFDEFRDKHETPQASDIYTLVLKKNGLTSSFPNVEIALRIYLCLMITNATGERSFSRLKHIVANSSPPGVRSATPLQWRPTRPPARTILSQPF